MTRGMPRNKSERAGRPPAEVSKRKDREQLKRLETETETVLREMKSLLEEKEKRSRKQRRTNVA